MAGMSALQRNGCAVYYSFTHSVDVAALAERWADRLTHDEDARFDSFRFERDRRDYLAAHVLVRRALLRERGLNPISPVTDEPRGWSLTHTEGFVACAIATSVDGRVGIDSEPISAAERLSELTDVFLSPTERRALPSDPNGSAVRMVEIWTAKEAVLKALGEGFSGEEGFGVLAALESQASKSVDEWDTLSVRDARTGSAYRVWRRWVNTHALAVVAIEAKEEKPRLRQVLLQGRR
jgi:phosphopantetheinyl transferase